MRSRRAITLLLICGAIALVAATAVPPIDEEGTDVWRPAVSSDSVPRSIAEAERQGSGYPRSGQPAEFKQGFQEKVTIGTSDRRCVVAGDANAARSGDLIVTPLRLYADYWRQGAPPKLTWAMAHRPRIGEPVQLIIRASRIDAPAPSHVSFGTADTYRWSAVVMSKLMRIQWRTAAVIDLPSSGQWLLTASRGDNWGCFVLDLPARITP